MVSGRNGRENDDEQECEPEDFEDEPLDIPVDEYVDLERQQSKWRWVALGLFIVFVIGALLSLRGW